MALPFFYIAAYDFSQKEIILDEDTSKHVVQVLRMKMGEQLNLTDGKGNLLTCEIKDGHKKYCTVIVKSKNFKEESIRKVSIAISLLKNANRFEWFLEKVTELGVNEIIPLICERTEKEKFRYDRMQGIVISAMLQSQQVWLPELAEPVTFKEFIDKAVVEKKFIAHCVDNNKMDLRQIKLSQLMDSQICIGPEGDFTNAEIEYAIKNNFIPIGLGETRLRTETAGVVAAVLLINPVA